MKKITMQDVADRIGVSRVTVSKAMNNSGLVSEELKDKIFRVAKEIGYRHSVKQTKVFPKNEEKKIVALAVSRPDSSVFWQNIIHSIAHQLSKENVNLMYTYLPSVYRSDFNVPKEWYDKTVSGVIIINVYDSNLFSYLNRLDIPKIFLDTPGSFDLAMQNGDIVYIGGRIPVRKITMDLIDKGHRRIGFIGDIGYASSNKERYDGFLEAMNESGISTDFSLIYSSAIEVGNYEEVVGKFLDRLIREKNIPDAMVCVSDYVAHFVIEHMEKRGFSIPTDMAVTGFDKNMEYFSYGSDFLTTAIVDSKEIGYKLVRQMLARICRVKMPYEISYLSTKVAIGQSSSKIEIKQSQ